MPELNIEYIKYVNFALINSGIDICGSASIKSENEDLHNVVVECSGEFFTTIRANMLTLLPMGQETKLSGFAVKPDIRKIATMTERVMTSFTVNVWADALSEDTKNLVMSKEYPIELMSYDQWLGITILPQSLAAFVTPNHPAISQMIVKAAKHLKTIAGESAFTEYQTGNSVEVRKQIAAVFAALHEENIVYRSLPASFEEIGQRITLPEQVLSSKLGNCIELSLLFASILEAIGIHSGVVIMQGHAYLAVWLVEDCCQYSACDDPSFLEKKCAEGIEEMLVLESTMVTKENTSFDDSLKAANLHLADLQSFQVFIDIHRCRLERIFPLPQRVMNNGAWELREYDGVQHENCKIEVKEHSRYDLSKIGNNERELTRMDIWERKLLDFSLRNNMLNLYLRQKAIQFVSFDIDKLEDHLQDGEEYILMEKPNIEERVDQEERLIRSKLHPAFQQIISNDIQHHRLHSYMSEAETKHTLKNIYRASRNAVEETGANSLFITIGALRWFETEYSQTPRYAPILMLPVEMVYKKGSYYVRTIDEDIMLNVTLVEFLRQNFDIKLPGLDPLPKDDHGVDVPLIFAIIRDALKNQKRWDVEEESILGVFSFSKFLMWNDIHNHREELLENKVVESLVEQHLTWDIEPLTSTLKDRDKQIKPEQLALPVPVDSSQMVAVFEAGKGHSFILYGPPGTGKSQTITNLIANALFQSKRVLFVAEKMAALSVVQSRLAKIGLDPFCLEMHSNKVTKRHILDQLGKALSVTHIVSPEEYAHTADNLYSERIKLIDYMEALHENKGTDGFSLYECIMRYESYDSLTLEGSILNDKLLGCFNKNVVLEYEHLLGRRLESVLKLVGTPSHHALLGMNIEESDLANEASISADLKSGNSILEKGISEWNVLASVLPLREQILKDNSENILNENPDALYQEWRQIRAKWFLPRFFAKRSFLSRLRQYNPYIIEADVDKLISDLETYAKQHAKICQLYDVIKKYFGKEYACDNVPTKEELNQMIAKLTRWSGHLSGMRDWYQWCCLRKELLAKGLDLVVDTLEKSDMKAENVLPQTMKSIFMSLAKKKIGESSILRTFEGSIFDDTVSLYKKLTSDFQLLSQKELYAKLASQIPHVTDSVDSSSEIGLLNRNISNGGRGLSLRGLLDQIPTLMPRLCPCMLMSPMSVAQYLSLTQDKFDLVIFDEASQMPTSEAVGAIARGKALIVVGDPKQMPPTSFFSSTNVNDDEADIDDMESILEDCRTLEIPSLQLNWHYRSQHESLIAFSNNEYYDGSLITFPSVDDQETKVRFIPINGIYDKGGKRSNMAEAEAIVNEIARRLKDDDLCKKSIGVIAFSVVQQNLIDDLLQEMLENNPKLREAADGMYEPIFVKNLENVQGDERDAILFSIGYGPDKTGKVSMNFGPLNNSGGERRLNVAVSRARQEMMVFSSLRASHIDLKRSKAKGVEGLKHFLEYAEQQVLVQSDANSTCADDRLIAEQIAKAIEEKGYRTTVNVGRSQFKVDIAISSESNPDIYKLGILLDGEGYHNTQTTRDREIVQPSVLHNLRWQVMRVWSVDWFNNPERVISRILERIENAPEVEVQTSKLAVFDISQEKIDEQKTNAIEYKEFQFNTLSPSASSSVGIAKAIMEVEQPMTLMQLCRRVCALRGIPRITPTIQKEFSDVAEANFFTVPDRKGLVLWLDEASSQSYTTYRPNSGRDVTDIPMAEIKNVVMEAITEQFSINTDSLSLIAAKKLGFTRRGTKVEEAFSLAIDELLEEKKIGITDNKLHCIV